MPNRRPLRCIGGTTATIAIIAGTIGTIGIIGIIGTGIAGKCDSLAQISNRPVSLRACFRFSRCHETGEIAARYLIIGISKRSPS